MAGFQFVSPDIAVDIGSVFLYPKSDQALSSVGFILVDICQTQRFMGRFRHKQLSESCL